MEKTTAISQHDAEVAIREINQIGFGLANKIPGLPKRMDKTPHFYSEDRGKQAECLYNLAEQNGTEVGEGYSYKGKNFTIEVSDPYNVEVQKDGQSIFKMENGLLTKDNLSKKQAINLDKDLKQSLKERNTPQSPTEKQSSKAQSRNPHQLAKGLHELNIENGKLGKDGVYEFKGANYTIKSRNSRNVTLTRDGESQPAFKMSGGRVKTDSLQKNEVAAIQKNIQVQRQGREGLGK